jgi:hypothetical protein
MAAKLTSVPWRRENRCENARRRAADTVERQAELSQTERRFDLFRCIRRSDDDVSANLPEARARVPAAARC